LGDVSDCNGDDLLGLGRKRSVGEHLFAEFREGRGGIRRKLAPLP
jgi:hypothetical protein